MKRAWTIIVVTLLVSAFPGWSQEVLTLDQAVSLALDHNRGLHSSALEVRKAKEKLAATRTRQFPSVNIYALGAQQLQSFNFTLERGVLGNYAGTGPLPSQDVHLKTPLQPTGLVTARVVQPLSTLIRIRRNLATLRTGVDLAKEQTRSDRQKVVREVKRVYYSLQQVESSLRSVHQTVVLYQELARLTRNYVLQEVALRADSLEVDTRLAKAEQSESLLIDQQATAREQLNQLLGRDVLTKFTTQPVADVSGDSFVVVAARQKALEQRPDVRQARLKELQAEQDLRAKKAEFIPEIAAEVNSTNLMNYGSFLPTHSNSIGFSVSWEPFDWGRKKHEATEKAYVVAQARNSERDVINAALIDINDKFRQLRQSRMQLQVARLSQETALESLRVTKNKYALQVALLKDMLQVQVALEQSNHDYQQALLSFWNARAEFERAMGEEQ